MYKQVYTEVQKLQKSHPTLVNHFQKSGNSNGKVSYICICIIFSEIFNIILASLSILKKIHEVVKLSSFKLKLIMPLKQASMRP